MSFDVVVTRFARERRESPAALLERVLGLEPAQARELTATLPSVVVARTTREHASLLAEQLRSEGADVQVVQAGRRAEPAGKGAKPETRRSAIREEVRVAQDLRSDDARSPAQPDARRAAVREVFAARAGERETMPRPTSLDRKVPDESAHESAPARNGVHAAAPVTQGSGALAAAGAALAAAPALAAEPAPSEASAQVAARAAEELMQRARESAAMVALVEKDLGTIDFARFGEPANETSFRNDAPAVDPLAAAGLASEFGTDPLFPAHAPQAEAQGNTLVDEFDDVINRPLAFAGAVAKPQARAKTIQDSEIEDLFSTPLRGGPSPARKPEPRAKAAPAASRAGASPLPPSAPVEVNVLEIEPKRSSKLLKIGALLLLSCVIGVIAMVFSDGDTAGAPVRSGGAEAKLESGDDTPDNIHVLVRMMPRGMDRSMGVVLRQLVTGTYNVQIETEGMPADTQCLLIKADDGLATGRMRKLLRTGARVPLSDEVSATLDEHEQSLRVAMGAASMKFKRVCLSVDLYKDSLSTEKPD